MIKKEEEEEEVLISLLIGVCITLTTTSAFVRVTIQQMLLRT